MLSAFQMDDDIDDDLLAAMLAEDEQDEARRNEEATLAPLMELTSSSVDTTPTNPAHYKLSDSDMGELFGCKKSAYDSNSHLSHHQTQLSFQFSARTQTVAHHAIHRLELTTDHHAVGLPRSVHAHSHRLAESHAQRNQNETHPDEIHSSLRDRQTSAAHACRMVHHGRAR